MVPPTRAGMEPLLRKRSFDRCGGAVASELVEFWGFFCWENEAIEAAAASGNGSERRG